MTYEKIAALIQAEAETTAMKHAPMHSHHEAFAVIAEELDEYWEEVRKRSALRDPDAMATELIQTAAMCVQALHDLL